MIPGPVFRFRKPLRSTWGIVRGAGSSSGSSTVTGVGNVLTGDTSLTFSYVNNVQTANAGAIRHNSPSAPSINDTLGRPFEITFDSGSDFIPVVGADISVDLGPGPLFEGTILTVTASYQNKRENPVWKTVVADYTYFFNRRRPFGKWVNTSASVIANYLISCFAPGFTGNGIQPGLPAITLTLDGSQDMGSVFATIARKFYGTFRLNRKDVQLYVTETSVINAVTDSSILLDSPVEYKVDTSQLRTRVYVKGGSLTQTSADVAAGATTIPVDDISKLPGSGIVLIDGQLIRYAGTNVTTVIQDTSTYPNPTNPPSASQSGQDNGGVTYPSGNYLISVSFLYPDGHTSQASPPALVHLDGAHQLQLDNIPQPPSGSNAQIQIHISEESDNNADGTVGDLGSLPSGTLSATIKMSAKNTSHGTFQILYTSGLGVIPQVINSSNIDTTESILHVSSSGISGVNTGQKTWFTEEAVWYLDGTNRLEFGANSLPAGITLSEIQFGWSLITNQRCGGSPITPGTYTEVDSPTPLDTNWPDGTSPSILEAVVFSVSVYITVPKTCNTSDFDNGTVTTAVRFGSTPGLIEHDSGYVAQITGKYVTTVWNGNLPQFKNKNGDKKIKVADISPFCIDGGMASIGGKTISYTGIHQTGAKEGFLTGITGGGAGSIGCCDVNVNSTIAPFGNGCGSTPPTTNSPDPLTGGYGTGNEPDAGTTPKDTKTDSADTSHSQASLIGCSPAACGTTSILPISKGASVQLWVQVDDFAAQAAAAAREGGDGIHEYVLESSGALTLFDCQNAGMIDLTLFGYPVETLTYDTHDQNSASGKMVSVNLTVPSVQGNFKIQSVQVMDINASPSSQTPPRFRVTASSVRFNMQDLLGRLILTGTL